MISCEGKCGLYLANDQTQEESETEELKETETEETKNSGDGNNTEEQKKLGIDIGPDVAAEIREVSCIQSSIVNSALSIDSFLCDTISFVWLLVLPNSSFLAPIISMSIPSFFCSSVLLPSPLFLVSCVSVSFIFSSVSFSSWVWSSSSCEYIFHQSDSLNRLFFSYIPSKMSSTIVYLCSG